MYRPLRRVAFRTLLVHGVVDGVEDAADENRLPDELRAVFGGDALDLVECEVRPGAPDVVEELELRHGGIVAGSLAASWRRKRPVLVRPFAFADRRQ